MNDSEFPSDLALAAELKRVCVDGKIVEGEALVKYLQDMPRQDKESLLFDLELLKELE